LSNDSTVATAWINVAVVMIISFSSNLRFAVNEL